MNSVVTLIGLFDFWALYLSFRKEVTKALTDNAFPPLGTRLGSHDLYNYDVCISFPCQQRKSVGRCRARPTCADGRGSEVFPWYVLHVL